MSTCEYKLILKETGKVYIKQKLVTFVLTTASLVNRRGALGYSGQTGWPFFANVDRFKGRHFVVTHAKKDPSGCNGLLFFPRKMG